jgi:hypothetical protein
VISPEEMAELVEAVKKAFDDPTNAPGGNLITYPQVWYLTSELYIRDARMVGLYRGRAVLVVGDRAWIPEAHLVYATHEAACVDAAGRQKEAVERLTNEYLATCRECLKFITDANKKKRDATKAAEIARKRLPQVEAMPEAKPEGRLEVIPAANSSKIPRPS